MFFKLFLLCALAFVASAYITQGSYYAPYGVYPGSQQGYPQGLGYLLGLTGGIGYGVQPYGTGYPIRSKAAEVVPSLAVPSSLIASSVEPQTPVTEAYTPSYIQDSQYGAYPYYGQGYGYGASYPTSYPQGQGYGYGASYPTSYLQGQLPYSVYSSQYYPQESQSYSQYQGYPSNYGSVYPGFLSRYYSALYGRQYGQGYQSYGYGSSYPSYQQSYGYGSTYPSYQQSYYGYPSSQYPSYGQYASYGSYPYSYNTPQTVY